MTMPTMAPVLSPLVVDFALACADWISFTIAWMAHTVCWSALLANVKKALLLSLQLMPFFMTWDTAWAVPHFSVSQFVSFSSVLAPLCEEE